MSLIVHALSYVHSDQELLFHDIHFSLAPGEKASLVGPNGTGKSTMLQILAGKLAPSGGSVSTADVPYYVPQHLGQFDHLSVAEALIINDKLTALRAILAGDASAENFAALGEDWELEERIAAALGYWQLSHVDLNQKMGALSGGEKTKVFLAGIDIHSSRLVLLDEPSNHLDAGSRAQLYNFIQKSNATMLLVSHDRTLLNRLDKTFELTSTGIEVYGGNYEFHKKQKEGKLHALQAQLDETQKSLLQAKRKARELAEQRRKQESRGKKQGQKQGLPRIVAGGLQRQAEQSTARLKEVQADKISDIAGNLSDIRAQVRQQLTLRVDLKTSGLHKGKVLVEAENINFSHSRNPLWQLPLTFQLRSGDRIRIAGANGSGKTTLVRLITGALQPQAGELQRGGFHSVCIDQEYSLINAEKTVFDQVQAFNKRNLSEAELKMLLHYHQFERDSWDWRCAGLSGGEKMKLALCCLAVTDQSPDLLILDEPTNNLDLQSVEVLTNAVKRFEGSLLVISHDDIFINETGVTSTIMLR